MIKEWLVYSYYFPPKTSVRKMLISYNDRKTDLLVCLLMMENPSLVAIVLQPRRLNVLLAVVAVILVLDADEDVDGNEVVTFALELVGNLELELVNALLVVVTVGVGLGLADGGVLAVALVVALVAATIALDEHGDLSDEVVDVLNLDLDGKESLVVALLKNNGEVAELVAVVGDGTLDGNLEVGARVLVVVPVVTANVFVTVGRELFEVVAVLPMTIGLDEGALTLKVVVMLVGAEVVRMMRLLVALLAGAVVAVVVVLGLVVLRFLVAVVMVLGLVVVLDGLVLSGVPFSIIAPVVRLMVVVRVVVMMMMRVRLRVVRLGLVVTGAVRLLGAVLFTLVALLLVMVVLVLVLVLVGLALLVVLFVLALRAGITQREVVLVVVLLVLVVVDLLAIVVARVVVAVMAMVTMVTVMAVVVVVATVEELNTLLLDLDDRADLNVEDEGVMVLVGAEAVIATVYDVLVGEMAAIVMIIIVLALAVMAAVAVVVIEVRLADVQVDLNLLEEEFFAVLVAGEVEHDVLLEEIEVHLGIGVLFTALVLVTAEVPVFALVVMITREV